MSSKTRSGRPALASICVAMMAAVATPAAVAAPINDDFDDRLTLQLDHADTRSNADGGIEPAEPLTANDPAGLGCTPSGDVAAGANHMAATMWWRFTGDGDPMTVSTLGSNFDTVLAVHEVDAGVRGQLVGCNEDIQPPDETRPNLGFRPASELLVPTVAGQEYAVQVGGCAPPEACGAATGNVTLRVSSTPPNDDRGAATAIPPNGTLTSSNVGATVEGGELTSCAAAPFAKTVWFRYTAPAPGTAVFSSSGFDTVLAVYRGNSAAPIGCNDDAVEKQYGSSRLPSSQPPGPPVVVQPGDYLVQVGGYYDVGFSTIAARHGALQVQVEFTADLDLDDDGVETNSDCDDGNSGIRPGLPEVPNNAIDENCDGIAAFDRDGDGVFAPPAGDDCRDRDAGISPREAEVRGNRVDEDCDGEAAPFKLVNPTISFEHATDGRDGLIEAITVTPRTRARIAVVCRGRGCDFHRSGAIVTSRRVRLLSIAKVRRALRLSRRERLRVQPGTSIEVRVTKKGHIGRSRVFRMRRGGPATPYHCLGFKGERRSCPSFG